MPTSPEQIRGGLLTVSAAAAADMRTVSEATEDPATLRAALFATAPLIVADYGDAAAALALDWFEEMREAAAGVRRPYQPQRFVTITGDDVAAMVARTTEPLRDLIREQRRIEAEIEAEVAEVMKNLELQVERMVGDEFRATMTENVARDPEAVGWKRFARPEACKFCKMLADRGAVYTKETARFAAHGAVMGGDRKGGNCMCIAGPEFGGQETWAEATPMQYVASQRDRTDADRAKLRDYLNQNYPDAPG